MRVVCIGSGYVGAVTGAAFAALGHMTTLVDLDQKKVDLLNSGKSPIFEPGLQRLVQSSAGKTLRATQSYHVIHEADVVIIGVGTPSQDNGTADLKYVKMAAKSIGAHIHPERFTVIVIKSTVPLGTAELVAFMIEETSGLKVEESFTVVSNPEFLREGYAVEDVFYPDRIIIGTSNDQAKQVLKSLYHDIVERVNFKEILKNLPIADKLGGPKAVYYETDTKSAEMIKYASNAFLAVKISYINELAILCEALGVNVLNVAKGMGQDPRIGGKYLQVSSGWSGSCFPKDTSELLATSRQYGHELSIVKAAVASNHRMHLYCVEKLQRQFKTLNGKQIGILGLTFKPDTDDVRETQASVIIKKLLELGCTVSAHDPKGMKQFKRLYRGLPVRYCNHAIDVAHKADAIVLLTHWEQYKSLNWGLMYRHMREPYILDTRNFLNKPLLRSIGFRYEGIGID